MENEEIVICPNPVTGNYVNIRYPIGFPSKIAVILCDSKGSLVKSVSCEKPKDGSPHLSIFVGDMDSGIYFGKMEFNQKFKHFKLLIR